MEATLDVQKVDQEIAELEERLLEMKKELTAARKRRPRVQVQDYTFARPDGSQVRLSELFGDSDDLLVIHNMGKDCTYCTLWADGFQSIQQHLKSRAGFALASADDANTLREFAAQRGWTYPVVAAAGNTFFLDMGFEKEGSPLPGVSAFRRENGVMYHVGKSYFGPRDDFCPTWPLFDLLQDGPNGWEPYADGY